MTPYEKKSKINFIRTLDKCIAEEQELIDNRIAQLHQNLQDPYGKHEQATSLCNYIRNNYMTIRGLEIAKCTLDDKK